MVFQACGNVHRASPETVSVSLSGMSRGTIAASHAFAARAEA